MMRDERGSKPAERHEPEVDHGEERNVAVPSRRAPGDRRDRGGGEAHDREREAERQDDSRRRIPRLEREVRPDPVQPVFEHLQVDVRQRRRPLQR